MQKGEDRVSLSKYVLDGIEADGLPGLTKAIGRMIGDNQPSFECVQQFDFDLGSAADGEQVWDAALDFAACLREAELDPEPPDPPEPPPEDPPDPPVPPDKPPWKVTDLVLAAFIVQLQRRSQSGSR